MLNVPTSCKTRIFPEKKFEQTYNMVLKKCNSVLVYLGSLINQRQYTSRAAVLWINSTDMWTTACGLSRDEYRILCIFEREFNFLKLSDYCKNNRWKYYKKWSSSFEATSNLHGYTLIFIYKDKLKIKNLLIICKNKIIHNEYASNVNQLAHSITYYDCTHDLKDHGV